MICEYEILAMAEMVGRGKGWGGWWLRPKSDGGDGGKGWGMAEMVGTGEGEGSDFF